MVSLAKSHEYYSTWNLFVNVVNTITSVTDSDPSMCCASLDLHFQSIRILCTGLIVKSDRVVLEKYIFGSILFNLKLNLPRDRMVCLCQVCTCISRNISVFCLQCTISCCYPGEQLWCHFQQGELTISVQSQDQWGIAFFKYYLLWTCIRMLPDFSKSTRVSSVSPHSRL